MADTTVRFLIAEIVSLLSNIYVFSISILNPNSRAHSFLIETELEFQWTLLMLIFFFSVEDSRLLALFLQMKPKCSRAVNHSGITSQTGKNFASVDELTLPVIVTSQRQHSIPFW